MPASSQPSPSPGRAPAGGMPPWAVSEASGKGAPPWEVSDQPRGRPPWEATEPPGAGGPPWPPSQSPPGAGHPPWPPADPGGSRPPTADRVQTAQPQPQPPVSFPGADSALSTGSLPAITGGLIRRQGTFNGRITRDGSSGFPAEPGRYQLYASLACPWSQRALIVCRLLGLDRVIGLTLTDPVADERGWRFSEGNGDPLTGARLLSDLYRATEPSYLGPYSVPLIWDMHSRRIVSNDVAQITIMLETEFRPFHKPGAPDLYPAARRRDIESLATLIFHTVNTGVYKAGLATTQESYEQAVEAVFTTLDALDERLARRRFLLGDLLTEADVRLYPTLARFDAVYYQMFNCNLRRLSDYPHLWAYARDLYTHPGFGETTDLGQIKRHYYQSTEWGDTGNRSKYGIIPIGPQLSWTEPHGR
ncbi:MAG TPA: glutathione S-transferase C-terminal domain-containing protein, partial [Streptosporangiaceae bacterium]|nr:glutathione S-transferase C-terminal domain-containing protein [Streptosporangiaceae bacterium]